MMAVRSDGAKHAALDVTQALARLDVHIQMMGNGTLLQ